MRPPRPTESTGAHLFDLLIRPLARLLESGSPLVVVPDRSLFRVSFPALYDRQAGRYLIEDRAVVTMPSLIFFAESSQQDLARSGYRSVLAIGGAGSSPLGLRDLPEAVLESQEVASLYATRMIMTTDRASERSFRDLVGGYDVLHFAGHAVFDRDQPRRSMLLLTDGDGTTDGVDPTDDGRIVPSEIHNLATGGLRLVVLSACSTLDAMAESRSSSASWAEAWLEAGIPTVVASQGEVYDAPTHRLMVRFHRALVGGRTPADALRIAQLSMLNEPLSHWAGFQVHGLPGLPPLPN